jgi:hypothetical protein
VFAKRFIEHRLVAATGGVRALSEGPEQVVVQEDGDARLAWLSDLPLGGQPSNEFRKGALDARLAGT